MQAGCRHTFARQAGSHPRPGWRMTVQAMVLTKQVAELHHWHPPTAALGLTINQKTTELLRHNRCRQIAPDRITKATPEAAQPQRRPSAGRPGPPAARRCWPTGRARGWGCRRRGQPAQAQGSQSSRHCRLPRHCSKGGRRESVNLMSRCCQLEPRQRAAAEAAVAAVAAEAAVPAATAACLSTACPSARCMRTYLAQASSAAGMRGAGRGYELPSLATSAWPSGVSRWPAAEGCAGFTLGRAAVSWQQRRASRHVLQELAPRQEIEPQIVASRCIQAHAINVKSAHPRPHRCHGCKGRGRPQRSGRVPAWQSPSTQQGSAQGSCRQAAQRSRTGDMPASAAMQPGACRRGRMASCRAQARLRSRAQRSKQDGAGQPHIELNAAQSAEALEAAGARAASWATAVSFRSPVGATYSPSAVSSKAALAGGGGRRHAGGMHGCADRGRR